MAKKTRPEEVIEMMKRKTGVTTAQIAERFGMEEHSARALISRLDVEVTKTKAGGKPTVYRIEEKAAA